jgi:hypothetical protein
MIVILLYIKNARENGFKIQFTQVSAGSIPAFGTTLDNRRIIKLL